MQSNTCEHRVPPDLGRATGPAGAPDRTREERRRGPWSARRVWLAWAIYLGVLAAVALTAPSGL